MISRFGVQFCKYSFSVMSLFIILYSSFSLFANSPFFFRSSLRLFCKRSYLLYQLLSFTISSVLRVLSFNSSSLEFSCFMFFSISIFLFSSVFSFSSSVFFFCWRYDISLSISFSFIICVRLSISFLYVSVIMEQLLCNLLSKLL